MNRGDEKNNHFAFVRAKESGLENEGIALTGGHKAGLYLIYIKRPTEQNSSKIKGGET